MGPHANGHRAFRSSPVAALQWGRTVQKSDPHYLSERKEEGGGGGQTGRRKEWMSSLVSAALTVRRNVETHTHTSFYLSSRNGNGG